MNGLRQKWALVRYGFIIGINCWIVTIKGKKQPLQSKHVNQRMQQKANKLLRILKTNYALTTTNHAPIDYNKPTIFMSNHQSLLDLILIFALMPGTIRMIAKKELFSIPFFGKAITAAGFIPVDRNNPGVEFILDIKARLAKQLSIWVFPEGTRSKDGNLLNFKQGVFRLARELKANIIPVGISGTRNILPPNTFNFGFSKNAKICVGQAIDTTKYTAATQPLLVQQVHDAITDLMK